ncbi:unnamed protein product [Rotaria socialis]|uniref:Uncharacterized protein n=1 Tax=Rotaria socialis TaxID=392032 RepID=A0A820AY71_9BILA|nr:unnamed protein product [Rotaria socialis]CAF4192587.1 unnamed protein product [Rotaria socialis]CAF4203141.1 unnamed protein product [Rotaria socialis]
MTIPVHTTNIVKTLDKAKTINYYCCKLVEDLKEAQPLQIGQMEKRVYPNERENPFRTLKSASVPIGGGFRARGKRRIFGVLKIP